ncbi:hypothetical protein [Sporichthya sp.]|uniref:hypothetical protein n=1 Tax=Sporichthya sp. TaxID=65475 RepID=UPI0017966B88|nr:hypothetical protein [Sporichthya sp.]MBA3743508.1 hypothetical protein [Sporichthya sp.]
MGERVSARRRERRQIVCRTDGSMYDTAARRSISVEDLRDHLLDGGHFEAETETGRDCTYDVLRRVMGTPGLDAFTGGGAGAAGPLSGLTSLTGISQLAGLASMFSGNSRLDFDDRNHRNDRAPAPPSRSESRARHRATREEFRPEPDGPTDAEQAWPEADAP